MLMEISSNNREKLGLDVEKRKGQKGIRPDWKLNNRALLVYIFTRLHLHIYTWRRSICVVSCFCCSLIIETC